MYSRMLLVPKGKSFFLLGPRGTGKSSWVRSTFADAAYVDLLEAEIFTRLLANPQRLSEYIGERRYVVIDEVQKLPSLLDEVHRLIEREKLVFVLTGSSARKLKREGVNLLAGRALTRFCFPLTVGELGAAFSLKHALSFGMLPSVWVEQDAKSYLSSYVRTYLKEEIELEGLTRNLGAFSRFLEQISFSQGGVLNISEVARESGVPRKTVEEYLIVLEDLLLAQRVPVFTKKAQRATIAHPKFYLFDAGVYRTIRPRGPLDMPEAIEGIALESLLFQQLNAINHYADLDYGIYYWRTSTQLEVDFVLYGERGIIALEAKRTGRIRDNDLRGLRAFKKDYPQARSILICGENRIRTVGDVEIVPIEVALSHLQELMEEPRDFTFSLT